MFIAVKKGPFSAICCVTAINHFRVEYMEHTYPPFLYLHSSACIYAISQGEIIIPWKAFPTWWEDSCHYLQPIKTSRGLLILKGFIALGIQYGASFFHKLCQIGYNDWFGCWMRWLSRRGLYNPILFSDPAQNKFWLWCHIPHINNVRPRIKTIWGQHRNIRRLISPGHVHF